MKVLIFFAAVFSSAFARDMFDVNKLNIRNLELDKDLIDEFLEEYGKRDEGAIVAVVNEYADRIFKNIQDFAIKNNLDPLNLTDIEEEFLTASLTLTNGNLNGIATLNRSDDVTVSYHSNSKILELDFPIVFTNLNFTYDYHAVILLIGPRGNMVGKIEEFKMDIKIQFDFNTYQAAVVEVKTSNKGHVSLTLHGNAVIDIVINILSEFTTVFLQPLIGVIIENVVKGIVDLVVDTVNNAIDGLLNPTTVASILL